MLIALNFSVKVKKRIKDASNFARASLVAQIAKNPPAMWETPVGSLGWEDPWGGTILWKRAWQPTPVFSPGESPWTEEPGGLQSMGSQRVRYD